MVLQALLMKKMRNKLTLVVAWIQLHITIAQLTT